MSFKLLTLLPCTTLVSIVVMFVFVTYEVCLCSSLCSELNIVCVYVSRADYCTMSW